MICGYKKNSNEKQITHAYHVCIQEFRLMYMLIFGWGAGGVGGERDGRDVCQRVYK